MFPVILFGPIDDVLGPIMGFVILGLALVNGATRFLAHRRHQNEAEGEDPELTFHPVHMLSNVLLVLAAFYYTTLPAHYHGGVILSMFVIGVFITDLFEFESRNVELRQDMPLDVPKAAIVGSLFVIAYAAYDALFFLVADLWNAII